MEKYQKMLYNRAWQFKGQIEFDEAMSVCRTAYMRAVETFDQDMGFAFSTYLWRVLTNHLLSHLAHERRHEHEEIVEGIALAEQPGPLEHLGWKDLYSSFTDEMKAVAGIVLDSPGELWSELRGTKNGTPNAQRMKAALVRIMKKKKGWHRDKTQWVFCQIEEALG